MNNYFSEYCDKNFGVALNGLSYHTVESESDVAECELKIVDTISYRISDGFLYYLCSRKLCLEPAAILDIEISFNIRFALINTNDPAVNCVDWKKEILSNGKEYLNNVYSRISLLISSITSANGSIPVITPPSYISG